MAIWRPGTDYIDSFVLHGPATGRGITSQDKEVWGPWRTSTEPGVSAILA